MSALLQSLVNQPYKHGFVTDIESDVAAKGLNEDTIRLISAKKHEPEWLLEFRLKAFRNWLTMAPPQWANVKYPKIDFQAISYYSAPKSKPKLNSIDEVDPELLRTFEKLGVPMHERAALAGVAVDVIFDSVSVATTYKQKLAEVGIIFGSISEAVQNHPELVKKYLGTVVPAGDNYYAALNSAVFTDGSFCFIPKGVKCPMDLSTYFRINTEQSGQFERTLIIAEEDASVSYLEGCTAPKFDTNQLHAAVVELIALDNADIKLVGDNSVGEFYSVAVTNHHQQADTGTKMIHIGKNTRSTIVSKGISAGQSNNSYRGLVKILPTAAGARNHSQCDSMLIGERCGANTFPYIQVRNPSAKVEHEASTSKVGEDQLFYFAQRGVGAEEAVSMIINGFCKDVFRQLPMEFAVEATKLLGFKLEGSVG
jgi:Fe-S cluster assembly protein SufB